MVHIKLHILNSVSLCLGLCLLSIDPRDEVSSEDENERGPGSEAGRQSELARYRVGQWNVSFV